MRIIFSQANRHCPPRGGHAAGEAALSKTDQMETSSALMVAQPLTAMTSQSPAKKGPSVPQASSSSKALAFFISARLLQGPAVLHPCAWLPPAPFRLHPVAACPMLPSGPGQGHLSVGTEGLPQLPAHSPWQLSGWDSAEAKKMSSWQSYRMTGLFFPPLGRGEGLEMLALWPRHISVSGSRAGTHGLHLHPPPKVASP